MHGGMLKGHMTDLCGDVSELLLRTSERVASLLY